jgi:serine/threonine protein kinase/Flp pilus assembly protein TadD
MIRHDNGTLAAPPSADDVADALEEYLEAAEAGTAPPREEFLARYPELAEQLDGCLAALRFIGRAADGPRSLAAGVTDVQAPEQTPGQLGDFRILREVGRGGMGVVYEAEQVSLGRRVALKVLPFAATMDPRQLQRFHNEARAAASLDHPHIVHVHAVGCERAVHFYAMQFIEGRTLAAVIADMRSAPGGPSGPQEQPTTAHVSGAVSPGADTAPRAAASTERAPRDRAYFRRVAEWGAQAAEALDHAHALGIVHRDVKPANLLVDGRGGLWVTDFGLAHVQSDARLTMTGDLVGTLRYMSPEQALAKRVVIDHRTDVYSLGATLYELLTLEPAFPGQDRQEVLRRIAFEEPRPIRRLEPSVPRELETIVHKALEKAPADRYATAQELAGDLRRFLGDLPIQARPPGWWQRAAKWSRRHKAAVRSAAAALLVVLAVVAAMAGWWLRDRAVREAATEKAVNDALRDAEDLQAQRDLPGAVAHVQRARAALAGGAATTELGHRVEERLKDLRLAVELEDIAVERMCQIRDSEARVHSAWARSDRRHAEAFRTLGIEVGTLPPEEAGRRLRQTTIAVELASALHEWSVAARALSPGDQVGWRWLLAVALATDADPERSAVRQGAAARDARQAAAQLASARLDQLSAATVTALSLALDVRQPATHEALLRSAQRRFPADYDLNLSLAMLLALRRPAKYEEALRFATSAVAVRPQTARAHFGLAGILTGANRLDEAAAEYRKAVELQPDLAEAHANLGHVLVGLNRLDEAVAACRKAVELEPGLTWGWLNLSQALGYQGRHAEAAAACRQAIKLSPNYAEAYDNLGNALAGQGRTKEAIAAHRKAVELDRNLFSPHYNLGRMLRDQGRLDDAVAEYKKAIKLKPDFAQGHCNLGLALQQKGRFAAALEELRLGHELGCKTPGWRHPSADWVRVAERLAELDRTLPAVLSGQASPGDANRRGMYAELCVRKHLYVAATRLYRETMRALPALAASPATGVRYNAACAAALAGCGKGEDAAGLTDAGRAALRKEALQWLRADLDAWRDLLAKDPDKTRPVVAAALRQWLDDADLAGVRGTNALAKLPEAERPAWQKLWADVADMLARSAAATTAANKAAAR